MIEHERVLGHAEPLRQAITRGLRELDCTIVQIPADTNGHYAVVLATVTTCEGLVFRAVGEASRDTLPQAWRHMVLTVAESRAKARALAEAAGVPDYAVDRADTDSEAGALLTADLGDGASGDVGLAAPSETAHDQEPALREGSAPVAAPARGGADAGIAGRPEVGAAAELAVGPEVRAATAPASAGWSSGVANAARKEAVQMQSPAKPSSQRPSAPAQLSEELGPDVLARLLHLTRKKAESEGASITEEEAMRRLDSYFQRAFGHTVSQGTRVEGQRVIQRLTSDLARLPALSGRAGTTTRV
jgi:hypothetical protein